MSKHNSFLITSVWTPLDEIHNSEKGVITLAASNNLSQNLTTVQRTVFPHHQRSLELISPANHFVAPVPTTTDLKVEHKPSEEVVVGERCFGTFIAQWIG